MRHANTISIYVVDSSSRVYTYEDGELLSFCLLACGSTPQSLAKHPHLIAPQRSRTTAITICIALKVANV